MSISVVYLSYIPYGKNYLERFVESYKKYKSGLPHELIILFNGFNSENEGDQFIQLIKESGIICQIIFTNEKLDITSYFDVATKLKCEYILFLNTYSVLLADNWCKIYHESIVKPYIGVVGSTGALGDFSHTEDYYFRLRKFIKFKFGLIDLKKIIYFRFNYYQCIHD